MTHFQFRRRDPRRGVFLLLILIVLAFIVWMIATGNASAEVLAMPNDSNGWSTCQNGSCRWGTGNPPNPYIITVPDPQSQDERDARDRRDRAWTKACDPHPVRDRYGVMRMHYAKDGCEFGSPAE